MSDGISQKQFIVITVLLTVLGVAWIIAAGVLKGSFWLAALPLVLGATGILGALKLYFLRPERVFVILGGVILWYIIVNFVLANVLSLSGPRESHEVASQMFAVRLMMFNIQLGVLSLLGFFFLVADLFRKK